MKLDVRLTVANQISGLALLLVALIVSGTVTCRVSSDQSLLENGPFGVS